MHLPDYDGDELQPELLRVEAKGWDKGLRDLNCDKNTGEAEDNGVRDAWYENREMAPNNDGVKNLLDADRFRIDSLKERSFWSFLGSTFMRVGTQIASLGAKDQVG